MRRNLRCGSMEPQTVRRRSSLPSLRAIASSVFSQAMNDTFGMLCLKDFNRGFTGEVSSRNMLRPALKATI